MRSRRMLGLLRKEVVQIRRDPSSIVMALIMPILMLLLNGFGLSLDARDVRVGLVIEETGPAVRELFDAMAASPYLVPIAYHQSRDAEVALRAHDIAAFLVWRAEAGRTQADPARPATLQLIVNGVDANNARLVEGYVSGAVQLWWAKNLAERRRPSVPPLTLETRYWWNPELRSANFIVPGLVALVMTLIGALLTALTVAREWERGTMEALMATPVSAFEMLAAKTIAYFGLGILGMAVSFLFARYVFFVPFRGSFGVFSLAAALFLLAALGQGLLISTLTRNQFVAAQFTFLSSFMPAMMLSGFLFDIGSMPEWVQAITYVVAARYFVAILQTLFLSGDVWPVLWPNLAGLALFATAFLGLTLAKTRKNLE